MRWLSVSSNAAGLKEQCEEIWQAVQAIKEPPDVALIFPVAADPEWYEWMVKVLRYRFTWTTYAGCCAVLAASSQEELYQSKGVAVLLGWLPGVIIEQKVITSLRELPSEDDGPDAWHELFGPPAQLQILLTVSHNSLPGPVFKGLDSAYPHTVRTGLCGDDRYVYASDRRVRDGMVVLSFRGALKVVAHGSDPWLKIGAPAVVTELTEEGEIRSLNDQRAAEYLRSQISDPQMREFYPYYPLYLGIGVGFQLQPTRYEKRPLGEMNSETGCVSMTGLRVGQQVQLYYHGPCRDTARFPIPAETRAALVFSQYNDQGFRRTSIPFLGVQGREAITNIEGFTCYESKARVGVYLQPGVF